MTYDAGLDVSPEETGIRVVDSDGVIIAERKVASAPRAIAEARRALRLVFERVGLEAGPLSPWLHDRLHRMVLEAVRGDLLGGRLMTVPGVGPITALAFKTSVDMPERFAESKTVGAQFGLTSRKFNSGEIDDNGRIGKCGDAMVRTGLR